MMEKIKKKIRSYLMEQPAEKNQIKIKEYLDFETQALVNRIWYGGKSYKLEQLYEQLSYPTSSALFWSAKPSKGNRIRKLHTGLAKLIVDVLSRIVVNDMNAIKFDASEEEIWEEFTNKNKWKKVLKKACKDALVIGDGAFIFNVDTQKSNAPLIKFIGGNKLDYVYSSDELIEVIVITHFTDKNKSYELQEHRGYGYIHYELYYNDELVDLGVSSITAELEDVIFDKSFMMAVPIMFYESDEYEGRGKSIFDGKLGNFDAYDESWSQWMDALRSGRTKTYIPENLIPRNPENGKMKKPNPYDNQYFKMESGMQEGANSKIEITDPDIKAEKYLQTYITALDQCIQGLISPSTLGIDVKKLDNAEAQREKEKATLYTRNDLIEVLQESIPEVIKVMFYCYQTTNTQSLKEVNAVVTFGEYANPSFESVIETVSKARPGQVIMSIEASLDELYGDSKDEKWKKVEAQRIRAESSASLMVEEPGMNTEEEIDENFSNGIN